MTTDLRTLGWSVADLAAAALNIASGGFPAGRVLELRRAGWSFADINGAIRAATDRLTVAEERELRQRINAEVPRLARAVAELLRQTAGTPDEPTSRRVLELYGFRTPDEVECMTDEEIRLVIEAKRGGAQG